MSRKVDAFTLAHDEKFVKAVRRMILRAWDTFGILPSAIEGETPWGLYPLLFEAEKRDGAPVAPLEALRRVNADRTKKGLPPVSRLFGMGIESVPDRR